MAPTATDLSRNGNSEGGEAQEFEKRWNRCKAGSWTRFYEAAFATAGAAKLNLQSNGVPAGAFLRLTVFVSLCGVGDWPLGGAAAKSQSRGRLDSDEPSVAVLWIEAGIRADLQPRRGYLFWYYCGFLERLFADYCWQTGDCFIFFHSYCYRRKFCFVIGNI